MPFKKELTKVGGVTDFTSNRYEPEEVQNSNEKRGSEAKL
jgi:hypothetical protein